MNNPEIRLIFCDVDGTLLKRGQTAVSDSAFHAIRQVVSRGIRFVIASGRSYESLKKLFAPVEDIVSFMCCDGALSVNNGKILYHAVVEKNVIASLLNKIELAENESLVIYGAGHAYCFGKNNDLEGMLQISSVDEINENSYKLAFFNISDFTRQKLKNSAATFGKISKIYSDALWTEFVSFGINKGVAAAALQNFWNISPLETAAFGDNTNDLEMLRRARLSFAAPAAVPDIKRMCKYQTKSVIDEILNISRER